jgi:hypothetical protein
LVLVVLNRLQPEQPQPVAQTPFLVLSLLRAVAQERTTLAAAERILETVCRVVQVVVVVITVTTTQIQLAVRQHHQHKVLLVVLAAHLLDSQTVVAVAVAVRGLLVQVRHLRRVVTVAVMVVRALLLQ